MSDIKENTIADFFKKHDIEIYGITPIQNLDYSIPEEFFPNKILKEAQSIICFASPIPKGVLYADSHDTLLFWRFCSIAYRNLDNISNSLSLLLENQGYSSTPINSCFPWKIYQREFWGLLPLTYWAEEAGLGKITKCGLLGNPQFGTRILLGGVITTKPMEKSEAIQDQICPEDCFKCIEICPVKAIHSNGKVNHDLCMRTANKNPLLTHLMKDIELREAIDFETIINTVGVEDNASYVCMECLKVCPLNRL